MTLRYTHIGIVDQAKALANLPTAPTALHGRCISDGVECPNPTTGDTGENRHQPICKEKTSESTTSVVHSPSLSHHHLVAARGVEPSTNFDVSNYPSATCTSVHCTRAATALQACGTNCPFKAPIDSELLQLVESWAQVPKHARETILALGRLRME